MLEDSARGLGRVSMVKYNGRYNAQVMDNRLVYFIKVTSWNAAALADFKIAIEKMPGLPDSYYMRAGARYARAIEANLRSTSLL